MKTCVSGEGCNTGKDGRKEDNDQQVGLTITVVMSALLEDLKNQLRDIS